MTSFLYKREQIAKKAHCNNWIPTPSCKSLYKGQCEHLKRTALLPILFCTGEDAQHDFQELKRFHL